MSPHAALVSALARLAGGEATETEREQFVFDLEHILKVLTVKETCALVVPCLGEYLGEQDYLKTELFRQIPSLVAKLAPAKEVSEGKVYPLLCQLLLKSEETVQMEGIEAVKKILGQSTEKGFAEQILESMYGEATEYAKVGSLLLLEALAKEGVVGANAVQAFVSAQLPKYGEDLTESGFKIKRALLQCLVTISKHLNPTQISYTVFPTFKKFASQAETWGLRRYCVQVLPEII